MILPGLLSKMKKDEGEVKRIRPCEPGWSMMPKPVIFEVMAIINDAARQKKCTVQDLCVQVHMVGDKLAAVKIYDKVRRPVTGLWGRVTAAWNILLKGRI